MSTSKLIVDGVDVVESLQSKLTKLPSNTRQGVVVLSSENGGIKAGIVTLNEVLNILQPMEITQVAYVDLTYTPDSISALSIDKGGYVLLKGKVGGAYSVSLRGVGNVSAVYAAGLGSTQLGVVFPAAARGVYDLVLTRLRDSKEVVIPGSILYSSDPLWITETLAVIKDNFIRTQLNATDTSAITYTAGRPNVSALFGVSGQGVLSGCVTYTAPLSNVPLDVVARNALGLTAQKTVTLQVQDFNKFPDHKLSNPNPGLYQVSQSSSIPFNLSTTGYFGYYICMSKDYSRIVMGAHTYNNNGGYVGVYYRVNDTFVLEQSWGPYAANSYLNPLGITADGTRILAGSQLNAGEAYVFVRSGGVWSTEATISNPNTGTANQFGTSGCINADGTTLVIGAPTYNVTLGRAYVYTRSNSTWSLAAILNTTDFNTEPNRYFGNTTAISDDGSWVAVGGNANGSNYGHVWVYNKPANGWQSTTTYFQRLGPQPGDHFAYDSFGICNSTKSIQFTPDASRVIIGCYGKNSNQGAAFIFSRTTGQYNYEAKITASDGAANHYFGYAVSISDDGATAFAGAYNYNGGVGKVYVFRRSGTTWSQVASSQATSSMNLNANSRYGVSLAVDSTGTRMVVGADGNNNRAGEGYIASVSYENGMFGANIAASYDTSNTVAVSAGSNQTPGNGFVGIYTLDQATNRYMHRASVSDPNGFAYSGFGDFGLDISSDGTRLVAGSCKKHFQGGSVLAWKLDANTNSWALDKELVADGVAGSNLQDIQTGGTAKTVSGELRGDRMILASDTTTNEVAQVFVYDNAQKQWVFEASLTVSGLSAGTRSPWVSISNNGLRAAVTLSNGVHVYVFTRTAGSSSWSLEQNITTGTSNRIVHMDASGSSVVVGAPTQGWAGVYVRSAGGVWSLSSSLTYGASKYGWAACISGDGSVVAAGGYEYNASEGFVYVHDARTMSSFTYIPSPGGAGTQFGQYVALNYDGTYLVVSANGGARAYVYKRTGSTWASRSLVSTLSPPTPSASFTNYASGVAISEDSMCVAVGEMYTGVGGAVHVYRRESTTSDYFLYRGTLFGTVAGGTFGYTCSISTTTAGSKVSIMGVGQNAVGASVDTSMSAPSSYYGQATKFSRNMSKLFVAAGNGGFVNVLDASSATYPTLQRISVASQNIASIALSMDDDASKLVVGCPGSGNVYVYTLNNTNYELAATLTAPATTEQFGRQVAMAGNGSRVFVQAQKTSPSTSWTLHAFLWSAGSWALEKTWLFENGTTPGNHALATNHDGSVVHIGAYLPGAGKDGRVYMFSRSGLVWSNVGDAASKELTFTGSSSPFTGYSVASSAGGNRLFAGVMGDGGYCGAFYASSLQPS